MSLEGMTQAKWDSIPRHEREALRDNSGLTPMLNGLEGWRVEVVDDEGDKPRRFIVGKSTGWRPCHLEIASRRSTGGGAARTRYISVRKLYKARP